MASNNICGYISTKLQNFWEIPRDELMYNWILRLWRVTGWKFMNPYLANEKDTRNWKIKINVDSVSLSMKQSCPVKLDSHDQKMFLKLLKHAS